MHYTTPYLEETLCFANIAKSHQRYICGYDWYPVLAGLIVTSYTFTTAATIESGTSKHKEKYLLKVLTLISEQLTPKRMSYNEPYWNPNQF